MADRSLPALTFAGQESFTMRDKNASDMPDCGNNCGNLCFWRVSGLPLNDSGCLFERIFHVGSSLLFPAQECSVKTFHHLSHRPFDCLPLPLTQIRRLNLCSHSQTKDTPEEKWMCYGRRCRSWHFQIDFNCF